MTRSKSAPAAHRVSNQTGVLIRKLAAHSHLSSYIRQLPAPALDRLIDTVGIEDGQEILAAMTPQQLKAVLSVSLWSSSRPGLEEALDLDQLMRWIEVWLQEGEQVFVQRVVELGEDFIVMCLSKLLVAFDRTTVGLSESSFELGQYVIFPKEERHWHKLVLALTALWHHEPDFVLHVLRRCSFERSILNEGIAEHGSAESLCQDITAERLAERADVGYVDPTQAAIFLSTAKTIDLQELSAVSIYDANTARYLEKQQQVDKRLPSPDGDSRASFYARDSSDGALRAPAVPGELTRSDAATLQRDSSDVARANDFEMLDSLLRDAGVLQPAADSTPALTDRRGGTLGSKLLEDALAALAQSEPDIASRRLGELAYLSNVLMSGAEIQGRTFNVSNAPNVAMATANLGLMYLLRASSPIEDEVRRTRRLLDAEPGIVRLFQVGYHLLCAVPRRCCEAVYQAKAVQARRPGRVVIQEMDEVLGSRRLTDLVNDGRYGEAKSLIDGLSAVMDSAACVALRILIDPTPCFPRVLDSDACSEHVYVDIGYRHIETMEDIERIAEFLHDLSQYCGN